MQLETVGEVVRILRSRRQLDQIDLARACGWRDASAVSRIETDRIRPTRRTLLKLAESLAGPGTPPLDVVTAWLFCAAGFPPSKDDVERMTTSLPALDAWSTPAYVADFSWTIWRANGAAVDTLGLPTQHVGRNLLEMTFDPSTPCRERLGEGWSTWADEMVRRFRDETTRRSTQRWYRGLVSKLNGMPDFSRVWEQTAPAAAPVPLNVFRMPVATDPRFAITQIVSAGQVPALPQ